jgi:hypothetical protein
MDLAGELVEKLRERAPDAAQIGALFDHAIHRERVAAARALRRAEQRALYAAAEGFLPLRLVDLVPPDVSDGVTVRHHGTNVLPAFTRFEKRFCRPRGEDREKPASLYGWNFQRWGWLTGPGYFVAVPHASRPEVQIDYQRLPVDPPADWPRVRSNERGLARLVYGFMVDTLRRVSEHVTIGSAARRGREIGSWFVLVRED